MQHKDITFNSNVLSIELSFSFPIIFEKQPNRVRVSDLLLLSFIGEAILVLPLSLQISYIKENYGGGIKTQP